jgi:S-DNA-T family DNA segregation ATPase FtsK/SpoIIIE
MGQGPLVVLIDDAEGVEDAGGLLERIVHGGVEDPCVVAAGRSDALRSQYGSWVRRVRTSRLGVLLQPEPDLDGDLLGVRLPRRTAVAPGPGRGWLVAGGRLDLVQLARPSATPSTAGRSSAA